MHGTRRKTLFSSGSDAISKMFFRHQPKNINPRFRKEWHQNAYRRCCIVNKQRVTAEGWHPV
jgi:hypothetical protein